MTGKVIVMDHPLITHKINYVRQENVGTKEFREVIGEIAQLMCYEATRDLNTSYGDDRENAFRQKTGYRTDPSCGNRNGRRNVISDSGGEGRTYRSLQRSGDIRTGRILL
mgnify:CR=1 FL=1